MSSSLFHVFSLHFDSWAFCLGLQLHLICVCGVCESDCVAMVLFNVLKIFYFELSFIVNPIAMLQIHPCHVQFVCWLFMNFITLVHKINHATKKNSLTTRFMCPKILGQPSFFKPSLLWGKITCFPKWNAWFV